MITTGSPAASLCATRGSEPTVLGAPFGDRHGTRLKISLAVFAACLTFSIALSVRLFAGPWLSGCVGFADGAWFAGGAWPALSSGAAPACRDFPAAGIA